ncbi:MAG: MATE family efflux transporter [Hominenteromicrobium sp.]
MDLTKGGVAKTMLRFTLPILFMNLINQAYNIADGVITARFINTRALSVISAAMAALAVGYCLLTGAANACSVLVARLFGEGERRALRRAVLMLALSSLVLSVLICAAYMVFAEPIVRVSRVPGEIAADCERLVMLYAVGFLPTLFSQTGVAVLNGLGDSKSPTVICISTQLLNIVLNLFAVLVLDLGLWGVAWASVFSVTVNALLAWRRVLRTVCGEGGVSGAKKSLGQYIRLALPSMLQQSVMAFGSLFLQVLVNRQGVACINGYSVGCNLYNLLILVVISCCTGYETFAAQNLGAGKTDRVRAGFRTLQLAGTAVCIALALFTAFGSDFLVSFYLTDPADPAFAFARQFLFLLIPNLFLTLFKYGVDAVFKANLKVYLFTISSLISLGARVAFTYAAFDALGSAALAAGTVFGTGIALVFDLAVFLPCRRRMGFPSKKGNA